MGPRHHGTPPPSLRRVTTTACALFCASLPAPAQQPALLANLPEAPQPQSQPQTTPTQQPTAIRGTILDRDGATLPDARIALTQPAPGTFSAETTSTADGTFLLSGVPPGPFTLTITAPGFATEQTSSTMLANSFVQVSPITLHPGLASDVEVTLSRTEIAEDQIHDEEKQRVLGFIPNFYVSYLPNPLPLTPRQKSELAWKSTVDPLSILIAASVAGIDQGANALSGYGPGIGGYGKRFGAVYGTLAINNALGGAVLPILLHQDPRYFYVGSGTTRHRIVRSVAQVFIVKGDNGRWQPDYSGIGGAVASAAIANLYLPSTDRNDAGSIAINTLNSFWGAAIGNLAQEFLVRHFTPHLPPTQSNTPAPPNTPTQPPSSPQP